MQVETVQVATLVADPANARKHSPKNLPKYCDVILACWEAFTGLKAVCANTGEISGGA